MTPAEASEYIDDPSDRDHNVEHDAERAAAHQTMNMIVTPKSTAGPYENAYSFGELAGLAWSSPSAF